MPITVELVTYSRKELFNLDEICKKLSACSNTSFKVVLEQPQIHQSTSNLNNDRIIPPPNPELGRNLKSVSDVRQWLGHHSNWKKTRLFVILWDGNVPKIAESSVGELVHDSFCEVVIREQVNRKRRPTFEPIPEGVME